MASSLVAASISWSWHAEDLVVRTVRKNIRFWFAHYKKKMGQNPFVSWEKCDFKTKFSLWFEFRNLPTELTKRIDAKRIDKKLLELIFCFRFKNKICKILKFGNFQKKYLLGDYRDVARTTKKLEIESFAKIFNPLSSKS